MISSKAAVQCRRCSLAEAEIKTRRYKRAEIIPRVQTEASTDSPSPSVWSLLLLGLKRSGNSRRKTSEKIQLQPLSLQENHQTCKDASRGI